MPNITAPRIGNPALTIKKRTEFNQVREVEDIAWEAWLEREGYGLDGAGHVYKKGDDANG